VRLRPPAADLQRSMDPPAGEAGLILVLAGGICLHHGEALLGWLPAWLEGVTSSAAIAQAGGLSLSAGPLLPRLAIATMALALPSALWLLVRRSGARLLPNRPRSWLLLYALLPLLWAAMLADHLRLGMAEAGLVLPVSLKPLLGAAGLSLPACLPRWSADVHVIGFCQSLVLAVGVAGAWVLLRRLLLPGRRAWVAQGAALLGLGVAARLLVGLA